MIYITCGTCGTSQGYKSSADGALSLPASEEARLVARGVADYVTAPIIDEAHNALTTPPPGSEPPAGATTPPLGGAETEGGNQGTPGSEPPAGADTEGEEGDTNAAEVKRLERMPKDDLVQMAQDMGVDISGAKNNHERAVLIVAAGASDNGDAPPILGTGDIVQ